MPLRVSSRRPAEAHTLKKTPPQLTAVGSGSPSSPQVSTPSAGLSPQVAVPRSASTSASTPATHFYSAGRSSPHCYPSSASGSGNNSTNNTSRSAANSPQRTFSSDAAAYITSPSRRRTSSPASVANSPAGPASCKGRASRLEWAEPSSSGSATPAAASGGGGGGVRAGLGVASAAINSFSPRVGSAVNGAVTGSTNADGSGGRSSTYGTTAPSVANGAADPSGPCEGSAALSDNPAPFPSSASASASPSPSRSAKHWPLATLGLSTSADNVAVAASPSAASAGGAGSFSASHIGTSSPVSGRLSSTYRPSTHPQSPIRPSAASPSPRPSAASPSPRPPPYRHGCNSAAIRFYVRAFLHLLWSLAAGWGLALGSMVASPRGKGVGAHARPAGRRAQAYRGAGGFGAGWGAGFGGGGLGGGFGGLWGGGGGGIGGGGTFGSLPVILGLVVTSLLLLNHAAHIRQSALEAATEGTSRSRLLAAQQQRAAAVAAATAAAAAASGGKGAAGGRGLAFEGRMGASANLNPCVDAGGAAGGGTAWRQGGGGSVSGSGSKAGGYGRLRRLSDWFGSLVGSRTDAAMEEEDERRMARARIGDQEAAGSRAGARAGGGAGAGAGGAERVEGAGNGDSENSDDPSTTSASSVPWFPPIPSYMSTPPIVIFAAPEPFSTEPRDPQLIALRSWLHLAPAVRVVLLGCDDSLVRAAVQLSAALPGAYRQGGFAPVAADLEVECNLFGVPLLGSVLHRMAVNLQRMQDADRRPPSWMAAGASWQVGSADELALDLVMGMAAAAAGGGGGGGGSAGGGAGGAGGGEVDLPGVMGEGVEDQRVLERMADGGGMEGEEEGGEGEQQQRIGGDGQGKGLGGTSAGDLTEEERAWVRVQGRVRQRVRGGGVLQTRGASSWWAWGGGAAALRWFASSPRPVPPLAFGHGTLFDAWITARMVAVGRGVAAAAVAAAAQRTATATGAASLHPSLSLNPHVPSNAHSRSALVSPFSFSATAAAAAASAAAAAAAYTASCPPPFVDASDVVTCFHLASRDWVRRVLPKGRPWSTGAVQGGRKRRTSQMGRWEPAANEFLLATAGCFGNGTCAGDGMGGVVGAGTLVGRGEGARGRRGGVSVGEEEAAGVAMWLGGDGRELARKNGTAHHGTWSLMACADTSGERMACADTSGERMACADTSGERMACADTSGERMACADTSGRHHPQRPQPLDLRFPRQKKPPLLSYKFSNVSSLPSPVPFLPHPPLRSPSPFSLARPHPLAANHVCLKPRLRPAICACDLAPFTPASQGDTTLNAQNRWICDSPDDPSFPISPSHAPHPTALIDPAAAKAAAAAPANDRAAASLLRQTPVVPMEDVLPLVALREPGGVKVVVLVAVTFGYAHMLMNFYCNLRRLGLGNRLVVAALDADLYRFAFSQGLPVYYEGPAAGGGSAGGVKVGEESCEYGTLCFKRFTKLKSRAVLRALRARYSVLWTDVDIVWFSDPLRDLLRFGPGTLPIQSNEPDAARPPHGKRRINSGFYFGRSDEATIAAFEAIVSAAAKTELSEQPSFYDVLCGEKGQKKVRGKAQCLWKGISVTSAGGKQKTTPVAVRTIFLDRKKYPNGAVHGFWDAANVSEACQEAGCVILHNNWISGRGSKERRLARHGFWQYDIDGRKCLDRPLSEEQLVAEEEARAAGSGFDSAEGKKGS
ncbi:unnamed protein product [Closterium sp. Naga37s-1]|nr:unnamed protein product [Closterium sp. Naga37s-1]